MFFQQFPDSSYLRAFVSVRPFTTEEVSQVSQLIEGFLVGWQAHGRVIPSAWALHESQVLLIAADTTQVPMKGCSGDSLFGLVEQIEDVLSVAIPRTPPVVYRGSEGLVCAERMAFGSLIREGAVGADTLVMDLTHSTVGALRQHGLEMPASQCWHGKAWAALAT